LLAPHLISEGIKHTIVNAIIVREDEEADEILFKGELEC